MESNPQSTAAIAAVVAEKAQRAALAAADAAKVAATCRGDLVEEESRPCRIWRCPSKGKDELFEAPKVVGVQLTPASDRHEDEKHQLKANAPWHRGRRETPDPSLGSTASCQNVETTPSTLWSAADFPSLAGDRDGSRTRSKSARRLEAMMTPSRSQQRAEAAIATPKRTRRHSDFDSYGQSSQNHWHRHNARNSYGSKSPSPRYEHTFHGRMHDRSSEQRCHSEPRGASNQGYQAQSYPSNLPGKQAVEVVKTRQDMAAIAQRMVDNADQMKLVGCPDPEQLTAFLSDHASLMQLTQTLQPSAPPSTAQADPAALVALNLLMMACSRNTMKKASNMSIAPTMAAISENSCKMQPRAPSPMVAHSSRTQSPSPLMVPMMVPVIGPSLNPAVQLPASMPFDEMRPWRNQSLMRVPSVDSFRTPLRARRSSKYSVVNPRTGEKLVISSVVPFRWRQSKRLRIVDPRTGEEVMPRPHDDDESAACDGHSRAGVMARVSMASSRPSIGSTTSASAHRSRKSLAGRAVQQGGGWALEPAAGGHWDWPLSRQEKKDRILMLSQLELLAEIEELQNAAIGDVK